MSAPSSLAGRLRGLGLTPARVSVFVFVWLMVGFASGTVTLLGPVRWLTGAMRSGGFSDGSERIAVLVVMAAYVASSFVLSLWTTRRVAATRRASVKAGVPVALLAVAGGAFWLWTSPDLVNSFQPVEITTVAHFTFGPYPDQERMQELVAEGYTGVISLLNPTAVPFEAVLLARERAAADEMGLELVHAPLLPWVGGNSASLEQIRQIASTHQGRYYVHCYLGRDRVGMAQRTIERAVPQARVDLSQRTFALASAPAFVLGSFERGPIHEIDRGVWLTPFPTDDELLRYFVASDIGHVVSLLDPDNPDDVAWIAKESQILAEHAVSYENLPISWQAYSPEAALAAAEHVRGAPRPVLVHGFHSDSMPADAFRLAFAAGVPPIPPGMFDEPLQGGRARIVGVNVVVGSRPSGPEFGTVLFVRGIRSVMYLGDAARADARSDKIIVESETRMRWRALDPDSKVLLRTLSQGGPWYVYGPGLGVAQRRIEERFGPARARLLGPPPSASVAAGQ